MKQNTTFNPSSHSLNFKVVGASFLCLLGWCNYFDFYIIKLVPGGGTECPLDLFLSNLAVGIIFRWSWGVNIISY